MVPDRTGGQSAEKNFLSEEKKKRRTKTVRKLCSGGGNNVFPEGKQNEQEGSNGISASGGKQEEGRREALK